MRKHALAALLLSSGCYIAFAPQANAQASNNQLEEVVVTALKQDTTVIETPATVDVVSASELAERNITSVLNVGALAPGVVMTSGVGASASVSFRGLGSNAAIFNVEPSVAQFSDGIYLGHARDFNSPLYDVDHIEFIRGTQSTLLGKNATLGAISIVNHDPIDSVDWRVSGTLSDNGIGNNVQGMVNLPLSDNVQLRVSGIARRDHGYYENAFTGQDEPEVTERSVRVKLGFQPTDNFDGVFMYQHDRREQRGQPIQVLTDPSGIVSNWIFRSSGIAVPLTPGVTAGGLSTRFAPQHVTYNGATPALGVPSIGPAQGPEPFDDADADRVNLVLHYQLGNFKLTSQTAYVKTDSNRVTDLDFSPAALFQFLDSEKSESFQQEFRLSSQAFGDRFQYLLGFFYYTNDWDYRRIQIAPSANTVGFPLTGWTDNTTLVTTDTWSVFASGTFALTEQIKLDAGLRYTHEEKGGNVVRTGAGSLASSFPAIPFTNYATLEADPTDYNVSLRWEPMSRVNLYLSYGKASKSGGFQDQPTFAATSPYAPEEAKSVEAGIKIGLDRGTLSGAVFKTEIDGFQSNYTAPLGGASATFVGNAQVETKGFELAADYRVLDNLRVTAQVVNADATFTEPFRNLTRAGDKLTRAPEWTAQVGVDFDHDISDNLAFFAKANITYSDDFLYQFVRVQPIAPKVPDYTLVDLGIGLRGNEGRWELALQGANITDEAFPVFITAVSGATGSYYGSYNRPSTVSLTLTVKH